MQVLDFEIAKQRLQKQEKLWNQMKSQAGTDHRIHVEFAHFSNLKLFELFERYAV